MPISRNVSVGLACGIFFVIATNGAVSPSAMGQSEMGTTPTIVVQSRYELAAQLNPQEKIRQSSQMLGGMKDVLKRSFELLEQARNKKDMIQLNCVNEKLTSMKGLLKISEQADINLQEAVARREKDASDHEFTKISLAFDKLSDLRIEAETCAGEALRYTGETQIEREIPDDQPGQDPTLSTPPSALIDLRPAAASPYQ